MALTQNQFNQTVVQGLLDLQPSTCVVGAQVASSEAGTLLPGQAVVLVDSAGGVPKVAAAAADTDDIYGFVRYDVKSQGFVAGDRLEVAAFRGSFMYMTASAAIARGAKVMVVIASKKVATATSGKTIVGRAFDKAAADGDLIRVYIDLPGSAA